MGDPNQLKSKLLLKAEEWTLSYPTQVFRNGLAKIQTEVVQHHRTLSIACPQGPNVQPYVTTSYKQLGGLDIAIFSKNTLQ